MNDLTVWILTGALSAAVTALIALLITRGALNRLRGERDQARDRLATLAEERDRQHQQQDERQRNLSNGCGKASRAWPRRAPTKPVWMSGWPASRTSSPFWKTAANSCAMNSKTCRRKSSNSAASSSRKRTARGWTGC